MRELRQDASGIVRRVEAGEVVDITVSGRLAARLVPAAPRPWPRWEDIADLFDGSPPRPDEQDAAWEHDRRLIDQSLLNPWERQA